MHNKTNLKHRRYFHEVVYNVCMNPIKLCHAFVNEHKNDTSTDKRNKYPKIWIISINELPAFEIPQAIPR